MFADKEKYQIGELDEALQARIILDVDPVELNTGAPWLAWLQQMLDLVTVHINGEYRVLRLPH